MKKTIICLTVVLIIIAIIGSIAGIKYFAYKQEYNTIKRENAEFEEYKDKVIYGLDVATIMNKAADKNTKNKIEKDESGIYICNDKNSIHVEIYIKDNEKTYSMETFYNAGTDKFVQYYGGIQFKCSKIEYHKNTGRIKNILFEQT